LFTDACFAINYCIELNMRKIFKTVLSVFVFVLFVTSHTSAQSNTESEDMLLQRIDSLLSLITPSTPDSTKAVLYGEVGELSVNMDTSLKYCFLSLDLCGEADLELRGKNNYYIAGAYYMQDENKKAINYAFKAVDDFLKLNKKDNLAIIYVAIGKIYNTLNIKDSVFIYFNKALDIFLELKDTANISYTYKSIGLVNMDMQYRSIAREYYQKALYLDSLAEDALSMAEDYQKLASTESDERKAIDYILKSIAIYDTILTYDRDCINNMYFSYHKIADFYLLLAKNTSEKKYADSCYYYLKKIGHRELDSGEYENYILTQYTYVDYLIFNNRYEEALNVLLNSKKYVENNVSITAQEDYQRYLTEAYKAVGNYKKAFECLEKLHDYQLSYSNDSTMNIIANFKAEEAVKVKEAEKRQLAAEKDKLKAVALSLIFGIVLVLLLVGVVFHLFRVKRKANTELTYKNKILEEQNEEIESQNNMLVTQKMQIEQQRNEIQKSISYARRIQRAMLTSDDKIDAVFPDHFLLYKPRDIVSGDYYWVGQFGDYKICVVADCTGHGVPGGFMSMLGITNLNYIIGQELTPDVILNTLRDAIIVSLRQHSDTDSYDFYDRSRDGMDVAIYVVNYNEMKLSYAGANIPLVMIRDNDIKILKPNKMPVGIYSKLDPFERVDLELSKGDCLYTFSDGFQDQFGIENKRKFMSRHLRELLLEIHHKPMDEQQKILNQTFEKWRGPAENQTDDVLIMGVRI